MKTFEQKSLDILYENLTSLYEKADALEDYNENVVLSVEEAYDLYYAGLNVLSNLEQTKFKRFKRFKRLFSRK